MRKPKSLWPGTKKLKFMELFLQDDVAKLEGRPEPQLHGDRVRFKVSDTCYYSIYVDKESGGIKVYKSGFPDDRISVIIHAANIVEIK